MQTRVGLEVPLGSGGDDSGGGVCVCVCDVCCVCGVCLCVIISSFSVRKRTSQLEEREEGIREKLRGLSPGL